MRKTVATVFAFFVLFAFAVSGAMAQTWTWNDPVALEFEDSDVFVDIKAYPDFTELYGSFDGTTFGDLVETYLGDISPSTLQFADLDISSPSKSVTGPNEVLYVMDDNTVGFQMPDQSTATAFDQIDQPIIPDEGGKFVAIAVGPDGKIYILFEAPTEPVTQYILIGNPPTVNVMFTPRSLNLGSKGNWVTCKLSAFPDDYTAKDIDLDSICITAINDEVLAEPFCRDPEGPSNQGRKLMVKFSREELLALINGIDQNTRSATFTMTGFSQDGYLQFYGEDTIKTKPAKVKKPKKEK